MKPTFALDFRNDAIGLLHRTPRGWQSVGDAALDTPDLTEALGYLRSTALGLAPRGVTTKLVIPNSQILYTTVIAPGPDAGRRRRQIAKALEGRTPYEVDDLVFDWSGTGPEVQVAVIARETLAEAEGFATEHRFNPLCFVAVPEPGTFKGEPWFGLTALAPSLLPDGGKVERDQDPIVITARDLPRAEETAFGIAAAFEDLAADPVQPPAEKPPADKPPADPAPVAVGPGSANPVAPPQAVADPEPEPDPRPLPAPAPLDVLTVEPVSAGLPEAFAALPDPEPLPEPLPEPEPEPQPDPLPQTMAPPPPPAPVEPPPIPAEPEPAPAKPDAPEPDPVEPAFNPVAAVAPEPSPAPPVPDEAPMAVDVADEDEAPRAPGVVGSTIVDDLPPPLATSALAAFASRRAGDAGTASKSPKPAGKAPILGAAPQTATRPQVARPTLARLPVAAPPLPGGRPKVAISDKSLRGTGLQVTAPGIPGSKVKRPMVQSTQTSAPDPAVSAASLQPKSTARSFGGGLGSRAVPVRGKPRYLGLILTGLLLLFLVLVAAWSTFLSTAFNTTDTPASDVAALTDATAPAPDDEMLADMQDPADFAPDPAGDAAAEPVATVETAVEPTLAPPVAAAPDPVIEPAPETGLATEASPVSAPDQIPQDEIFLATMDEAPRPPDALAMPQPAALADPAPAAAVPPPPFGTVYQFEANGLIKPTPEGIRTPEGVLLVAGLPPLIPPPRPPGLTAAAPAVLPEAEAPDATLPAVVDPELIPGPADPALANVRPRSRPAGLNDTTAGADDDASLAPATDSRFASLRPRARPAEILAAGTAARLETQSASLAVLDPDATASPLALVVARKPAPRPRDMSRAVEAAVAAAVRQPDPAPDPEPDVAAKPRVELEADDEPEIATAMPRLPTKASVAKQATFVNAINLSRTNLIGVYGTQSSRYALVRLSSGRYKKVKVGDNIDGGKVAAITSTEVRYQKGGRMVTLALPKG